MYEIVQSHDNGVAEVRFDMITRNGKIPLYQTYTPFSIGDATTAFKITFGPQSEGTAGESFSYHNNAGFTTKDRKNDLYVGSSANW
jgi:hypothetical protein